jgi:hypothetical protein
MNLFSTLIGSLYFFSPFAIICVPVVLIALYMHRARRIPKSTVFLLIYEIVCPVVMTFISNEYYGTKDNLILTIFGILLIIEIFLLIVVAVVNKGSRFLILSLGGSLLIYFCIVWFISGMVIANTFL